MAMRRDDLARRRRTTGTMAGGAPAPIGQPPVGGVRGKASEMYRNAILRRLGSAGPAGATVTGQTPTQPSADALKSMLQTRNSRRVLRRRGDTDEHDYR